MCYLMCVFEEKLDETTLENLQDFEFARAITGDLVSQILLFSAHLLKALIFSAELDCFLSLEMTVDTVIPNDTKIHDDGKSIYIKQVALIVFLSHIGSFVPADAATVGLTDRMALVSLVLVCTHLTKMFNDSCIQESDNIKYYTMSVLQPDDGLFLDMHFLAMGCIVHYLLGVPEEVIKRAASSLNSTGNNNHVNRLCNDKISAQDRQYKI
ncbi:unnamed protein product [Camellia sinensis]